MKKNLLSIIILSLLVVNIALTAIMMFSVMKTNEKTAAIVTDIADILALELEKETPEGEEAISLANTEVFSIEDKMTIPLKQEEGDSAVRYFVVKVSFSMNTQHADYEQYKDLSTKQTLIQSEIISVIGSYTLSEAQLSQEAMCDEILRRVQAMYNSDFIYKVSFSDIQFG